MKYKVAWQGEMNVYLNVIRLTGVPFNFNQTKYSWRILLYNAIEIISLAETFGGRLLDSEPPKRDGEFVYFEVIFESLTDCESFLQALGKKSS